MSDACLERLRLVAHRGYPEAFPENTLLGYQQSVVHGARCVETDVQCTRDGVPVLYHDASTLRLSGVEGTIGERSFAQIQALSAHHPQRFGSRFHGTPIPSLQAFAGWLRRYPAVTALIEIKGEALDLFGIKPVMRWVMRALDGVTTRCVIISFDDQCIEHARRRYGMRTGWVLQTSDARAEARARELAPEVLFIDRDFLPANPVCPWPGPWQWGVYVVNDLDQALSCVEAGFRWVETDAIGDLLDQYRAGPGARG